jgi:anti-sigma factor RsiW
MDRTELKDKLMPLLDGELDPATTAEVERALADAPELQAELAEMKRVNAFAHEAIMAPAAGVDLSGVYAGVMAKIAAESRVAAPSLWSRVSTWFAEVVRLERPMVLVGVAAALLGAVVLLSSGESAAPGQPGQPSIAGTSMREAPRRRGAEEEVKVISRAGVTVERLEANKGKVFIDFDQNDPEAPMVLWHVMDGEGIEAPKGL